MANLNDSSQIGAEWRQLGVDFRFHIAVELRLDIEAFRVNFQHRKFYYLLQ